MCYVEKQKKQTETNEGGDGAAQHEGVAAVVLDDISGQKLHDHFSSARTRHQDSRGTTFVFKHILSEGQHGREHAAYAQTQDGRPNEEERLTGEEDQQQAMDDHYSDQTQDD